MLDEPSYQVFDTDTCRTLVDLIAALMSSPPQTEHITAIVQFLILSHPADATYVTHLRSNFYFLLPTTSTVSSNLSQKRRIISDPNSDEVINNARSNVLSNGLSCKMSKLKNNSRSFPDNENVEMNFNFSVDPVKLNKALSDLQVKQDCDEEIEDRLPSDSHENDKYGEPMLDGSEKNQEMASRHLSKTNSSHSIGTNSIQDSLDGNGCDSGIAGSFKDNIYAVPQKQDQVIFFSVLM